MSVIPLRPLFDEKRSADELWDVADRIWRERLADFGIKDASDPVSVVTVHHPKAPEGNGFLLWLPEEEVAATIETIELDFLRHQGGSPALYDDDLRGIRRSAHLLWQFRGHAEAIKALLILATLHPVCFSQRRSERRHLGGRLPYDEISLFTTRALEAISAAASAEGKARERFYLRDLWHYACTDVLPVRSTLEETPATEFEEVIYRAAEDCGRLLNRFRLIFLKIGGEPNPETVARLAAEQRELEEMRARSRRASEERIAAWEAERERARRLHPRAAEWHRIERDELERLVWSKPAEALAKEFGVSGPALGKRCKTLGIAKPPRGFWSKVASGKLPHPGGVPQGF